MKNKTARTTMMNRTAGLILVPDDGGGGGGVEEGNDESLWKVAPRGYGGEEKDLKVLRKHN